jgi:hypothetical protein
MRGKYKLAEDEEVIIRKGTICGFDEGEADFVD